MLILLLYCPSGLISIVDSIRDQVLAFIARRTDWKPPQRRTQASVAALSDRPATGVARDGGAPPLLHARDVSVSFSGRPVVVGASIEVRDGEVVEFIGTTATRPR